MPSEGWVQVFEEEGLDDVVVRLQRQTKNDGRRIYSLQLGRKPPPEHAERNRLGVFIPVRIRSGEADRTVIDLIEHAIAFAEQDAQSVPVPAPTPATSRSRRRNT